MPTSLLLNSAEAARMLGITAAAVDEMRRTGVLPAIRIGNEYRYLWRRLTAIVSSRG